MIFNIPKPLIICLILSVLLTSTTGSSLTVPETDPVEITPVEIPPEEEVNDLLSKWDKNWEDFIESQQ